MRYWGVTILAVALFVASVVIFCEKLTDLLDTGTCASGNQPYVIAVECPEGTETDGLLLGGSILALLAAGLILVFRGPRPEGSRSTGLGGMVLAGWAVFFTVTGAVSLIHSLTSDVIGADGKTGGTIVGVTFLLMGLPVLAFVLAGLVSRLRGRDEVSASPAGVGGLGSRAVARLIGAATAQRARTDRSSGFRSDGGAPSSDDMLGKLERLQRLRESGALTDAEFERQKQRVLGGN